MKASLLSIFGKWKPVQYTLGLEITEDLIKLSEVKQESRSIVTTCAISKLNKNTIRDGRIVEPAHVILALQSLVANHHVHTKHVHLVVPSHLIMVRFLKLPDLPDKDLKQLIDFEVKHNIHLPFENPFYDYIKVNGVVDSKRELRKLAHKALNKQPQKHDLDSSFAEVASSSELGSNSFQAVFDKAGQVEDSHDAKLQCDVILVAAPGDLIEQYVEVVTAAGLSPQSIEIKAFSLYRLFNKTNVELTNHTILLVDVNEHSSDLSIFHDGVLKITRNVPINFTKQAEHPVTVETDIFFEFQGTDSDFKNNCNDLAHEIERLMNFYKYTLNNRNQEFDKVVISGDVCRLNEIVQALESRLSQNVEQIRPDFLDSDIQNFETIFPSLSVPIGLALRGRS